MSAHTPDPALRAFQEADFNWAVRLQDIWATAVGDVPDIHRNARHQLLAEAEKMKTRPDGGNPLGWFLTGSGGTGKTHLLNAVQDQLVERGFGFVLVDMTDVRDFWETVAQGYITSLQNVLTNGRVQYAVLLERFIGFLSGDAAKTERNVRALAQKKSERLKDDLDTVLNALARKHQREALRYQDTVRALICLNSGDFGIANMGSAWLQGLDVDETLGKELNFLKRKHTPREIVQSLSWLMSLTGPTVLAFEQLDPIVHQVARQTTVENADEQNTARWIIDQIGNGLGALRDTTTWTMAVVSCIETTYEILTREAFSSNLARFHPPVRIMKPAAKELESLVRARLAPAYAKHGFVPPHPTWPFAPAALAALEEDTPRRILQLCDEHQRRCAQNGAVAELTSFRSGPEPIKPPPDNFGDLDQKFAELRAQADPVALLDERNEDAALAQLYQAALECLKRERGPLPAGTDAVVEREFGGGKTNRPLHARLRLILHTDNEREEHFCVRAVQKANHAAFKTRLKAAITHAGIDRTLTFRRLTVVRRGAAPGGPETQALVKEFQNKGGVFHDPGDDELRTLSALSGLLKQNDPRLDAWLTARRPIAALRLPDVFARGSRLANGALPPDPPAPSPPAVPKMPTPPAEPKPEPAPTGTAPPGAKFASVTIDAATLFIGQKVIGPDRYGESVGPPLTALAKHAVVLAGAGSGKTVLLYRLVEEAALRGVPSIVVDCANDLSSFDEPKSASPHWLDGDADRADRFRASSEMVLWTPGKKTGNPLTLHPLPDFSAVKGDPEELADALLMADAALAEIVAPGTTEKAKKKRGILTSSLAYFARNYAGGTLGEYADMLKELPDGAGPGVSKEKELAVEMADAVRVQMTTNPLLNTAGAALDPAILFGDDRQRTRTRISVISLVGLPTLDMQRTFLNQLAMVLFSWIKKHPNPPGRALRGLLVVDEAKDFLPAQKATECKESMLRLGAQGIFLDSRYGRLPLSQYGIELVSYDQSTNAVVFRVIHDTHVARFEMLLRADGFAVRLLDGEPFTYCCGRLKQPLEQWLSANPPCILFVDGSELDGSDYIAPTVKPVHQFPPHRVIAWSWAGTDIEKESMWKDGVFRTDSVQHRAMTEQVADGFTVVFDYDSAGEVADLVCIREDADAIVLRLLHCKFSGKPAAGKRVKDAVEVCSQAVRSSRWVWRFAELCRRLLQREMTLTKGGGATRFHAGDAKAVNRLAKASRFKTVRTEIIVVQPGIRQSAVTADQAMVLNAAHAFLMETVNIPLTLICNS